MRRSRMARVAPWLVALSVGGSVTGPRSARAESGAAAPTRAPHPEPRVIVTVTAISGPHDRAAVQRAARETWGGIVRCYKKFAQGKQGAIVLVLKISEHGHVSDVQRDDSEDSKLNGQVAGCLMRLLGGKTMPVAPSASVATIQIQLAPGND